MRHHSKLSPHWLRAVAAVLDQCWPVGPDAEPARLTAPLVASRSVAATDDLGVRGGWGPRQTLIAQGHANPLVASRLYA